MAVPVIAGATLSCTMGLAPGQLNVTSQFKLSAGGRPVATIADAAPITNITPCGMCQSLANPTVASATAAALGVLTPMPCIPAPLGAWICSSLPRLNGQAILSSDASITCMYGGRISIVNPGQMAVKL